MALTHSPDPQHLGAGAGTAAAQTAVARQYAGADGVGYQAAPAVDATGAAVGSPGIFTPAGARTPETGMDIPGLTASPTSAWPVGTYVKARNGDERYWNGTAWTTGRAPALGE